jgi:hypothetical protein
VERDLQVLGVRRWKELVIDGDKWRGIVRQAKAHSVLCRQRKKKKLVDSFGHPVVFYGFIIQLLIRSITTTLLQRESLLSLFGGYMMTRPGRKNVTLLERQNPWLCNEIVLLDSVNYKVDII